MLNLAALLWRRLLRKRWVLALVFGLSLVYFLSNTFKQVSDYPPSFLFPSSSALLPVDLKSTISPSPLRRPPLPFSFPLPRSFYPPLPRILCLPPSHPPSSSASDPLTSRPPSFSNPSSLILTLPPFLDLLSSDGSLSSPPPCSPHDMQPFSSLSVLSFFLSGLGSCTTPPSDPLVLPPALSSSTV